MGIPDYITIYNGRNPAMDVVTSGDFSRDFPKITIVLTYWDPKWTTKPLYDQILYVLVFLFYFLLFI